MEDNSKVQEVFLKKIFDREASGIMQDLLGLPVLMSGLMFADESSIERVKEYIFNIFLHCYQRGEIQVAISNNEDQLIGYAVIFMAPQQYDFPVYCHKIFVYEEYRGNGIGTGLIKMVLQNPKGVCLLCHHELIPFYVSVGMEHMATYSAPEDSLFEHTRNLYNGLDVMVSNYKGTEGAPIFMLNDNDIRKILQLL